MQSILDGVTLGATQRAEGYDPAMVEGEHDIEKEVHVAARWVLVEMHATNWATAQREDPELDAILHWLEAKKKINLRTLLGEHASSEEGWIVWRNHQNFMVLQDALYLHSMPKGENEGLLLFRVPKKHQTATLYGSHQDVGHQGHDHTLSLLQEHFWWPGMAKQMRQTIRVCTCCLQYEGGFPKAPLCPIVATAPLDLLHVDFKVLRPCCSQTNHLELPMSWFSKTTSWTMCWHMWPLIKLQKPSPNFYMEVTSLSLGALARLLSDRGASFMSSIIEELCKILGIKWLQTTPYHPQTNGLVERLHQKIMYMTRKLGEDKKADGHLIWLK